MKDKMCSYFFIVLLVLTKTCYANFRFEAQNNSSALIILHTSQHRHLTLLAGDHFIYTSKEPLQYFLLGYINSTIGAIEYLDFDNLPPYEEYLYMTCKDDINGPIPICNFEGK